MPPTTAASSMSLNAWLGATLVVANGWLFYRYLFFFDARATDWVFYGPVLVSFLTAQWLGLALSSAPPFRRWFWVAFRLSMGATIVAWLAYAYLLVWARLHIYHY